jgi:flagellar hook-associated protein FlgK
MKRLLIFILILQSNFTFAQEYNCMIDEGKNINNIPDAINYAPDEYTQIKYIKVNVHFMLMSDGTGNFTETDDGISSANNFTGFDYANQVINSANYQLSSNQHFNLPPGNNTPILDRKYRYVLEGVYFHRNSDYYYYNEPENFFVNGGSEINLFFHGCTNCVIGGNASMSGDRYVNINGSWLRYYQYKNGTISNDGIWVTGHTVNHEIGHNLSLSHTVRWNS